jgi:hypothetical protein
MHTVSHSRWTVRPQEVVGTARPRVISRIRNEAGPDGIHLDVLEYNIIQFWIDRVDLVTILPELSRSLVLAIEVLGVSLAQCFHEIDHPVRIAWQNQKMNVIGHQAVSKDWHKFSSANFLAHLR